MNIDIYRIFNAVGDSVLLCTLIKELDVKTITYNRADLDTLKKMMPYYDVDVEFKQRSDQGVIGYKMHDYVRYLNEKNVQLSVPNVKVEPEYDTCQLGSFQNNAADRAMTKVEYNKFRRSEKSIEVSDMKTIPRMMECLSKSQHHVSIDSGTAWVAASMGIDTIVYSKNSYYFADAYFYMKYLDSQPTVEVHQQHGSGVRVSNELEFQTAILQNNARVDASYETYRSRTSESSRIRW